MKEIKDFNFYFSNRVVLVTGSSKGTGAGIARCFAKAKGKTVIHFKRCKVRNLLKNKFAIVVEK